MQLFHFFFLTTGCLLYTSAYAGPVFTEKPKVTRLFNGSDTGHWEPVYPDGWTVRQGTLTPSQRFRKNNYLWTRSSYQDFILTLQYKLSEGSNSGVFIRTNPSDPVQGGIEIQLLDGPSSHALNGELDKHSNGAIYDAVSPREYNNRPAGQWNSLLIYTRGPRIAVYVNGNQVASAILDHWTKAGYNPDGSTNKFKSALASLPHSGKIGLQYHGKPVWFRDISVTELDETSPDLTQITPRPPADEDDLRHWLENMIGHHRYTNVEAALATGLTSQQIAEARERFDIHFRKIQPAASNAPLLTLPYPGGRHPRIGFLDGAIDPQRETKLSVFLPWDTGSYAVVDVPEAIISNLGLIYLAHTHFPTIWNATGTDLENLEWNHNADGSYGMTRTLPNAISFTTVAIPTREALYMRVTLTNGTAATLTDLHLQNCVMLRGADGFTDLTTDNKILTNPYAAVHNATKDRWIITAWETCLRSWGNPNCPCLHSDPRFPDCPPGETVSATGILTFFEGADIQSELDRLDKSGWRDFFADSRQPLRSY